MLQALISTPELSFLIAEANVKQSSTTANMLINFYQQEILDKINNPSKASQPFIPKRIRSYLSKLSHEDFGSRN